MKNRIIPMPGDCLVKPIENNGDITIKAGEGNTMVMGIVCAVAPTGKGEKGMVMRDDVRFKEGDKVMYSASSPTEITQGGETYHLIGNYNIRAKIV